MKKFILINLKKNVRDIKNNNKKNKVKEIIEIETIVFSVVLLVNYIH